jgi:hypothetical protein
MVLKEKYINPFTDFGFKKLFGTDLNKEMPHFTKTEAELETSYDKWLFVLKHLSFF